MNSAMCLFYNFQYKFFYRNIFLSFYYLEIFYFFHLRSGYLFFISKLFKYLVLFNDRIAYNYHLNLTDCKI